VRLTIDEVVVKWEGWVEKDSGLSAKTITRYASSLIQLEPFVTGKYLDEIDKALIGTIVAGRQAQKTRTGSRVTNATIKRDLTAFSSVLGYAVAEEWRDNNPVLDWLRPDQRRKSRLVEKRDPIVLPDPDSVALVVKRAPGMIPALVLAARATGAREDELVKGRRHHFERASARLTVVGKRNKLRVIDLEPFGGSALFASLPAPPRGDFLFWHSDGENYKNISANFNAVVKRVGAWTKANGIAFRKFKFHALRHLHAVEWLRAGYSIYRLQKRLGHASIKTTEIYLQFLTPEEEEIVKELVPVGNGGRIKNRNSGLDAVEKTRG
jgi:integrase/recombinase XerD